MKTLAEALAPKFPESKPMEFPVHSAPWLPALLQDNAFLEGSPEFKGVELELPLSTENSDLLSTAYSERYGWAYDNLKASARRHAIGPDLPAVHPMVPDTPPPVPTAHRDRQPLALSLRGLALALLAAEV